MIAHVATSGENRGRVLVLLQSARPSRTAIGAAVRFAEAHQASIETLFVADRRLFDAARHAGGPGSAARAIGSSGREEQSLDADRLAFDLAASARLAAVEIGRDAGVRGVPVTHAVTTGEPIAAVAEACARVGPWNIVVDASPLTPSSGPHIARALREVSGSTGFLLAGQRASHSEGPITVVAEEPADLPPMLRTAHRLAVYEERAIKVLMLARNPAGLAELEGLARLALVERDGGIGIDYVVRRASHPLAAAEIVRQSQPGFVIVRHGGLIVPEDADLGPLVAALEAPLLIVR